VNSKAIFSTFYKYFKDLKHSRNDISIEELVILGGNVPEFQNNPFPVGQLYFPWCDEY